ncbi:MAG: hypothetical protein HRU09_03985 [Oligoflexales bacterium]|nr:hypothetical protein [Oligoflexales bacterium]
MEETQQNSHVVEGGTPVAVVSSVGVESSKAGSEEQVATEYVAPKGYLPFVEARKFAVSLNLKTRKEWRSYVKGEIPHMTPKPANIPAHPDGIYKVKGWQGWKYWLGTADVGLPQRPQLQQ